MRLQPNAFGKESIDRFRVRLGGLGVPMHRPLLDAFRELEPLAMEGRVDDSSSLSERLGIGSDGLLASCMCNQEQMLSPDFRRWMLAMRQDPGHMHRKQWEWAFVAQALHERGMLVPGRRGMGFAVGQEPLTSLFCAWGCRILATDVEAEHASGAGWVATGQHAESLAALNKLGLADPQVLRELASFRAVDMRAIPDDLGRVDFLWSACAFEHLGDLRAGMDFVSRSFDLLEPGGVAVHTTEFNLDSDWTTIGVGSDAVYRRCDLEEIARGVRAKGGRVRLDFREGNLPADLHVDQPPFKQDIHLRLELFGYRCTSFGLILERPA